MDLISDNGNSEKMLHPNDVVFPSTRITRTTSCNARTVSSFDTCHTPTNEDCHEQIGHAVDDGTSSTTTEKDTISTANSVDLTSVSTAFIAAINQRNDNEIDSIYNYLSRLNSFMLLTYETQMVVCQLGMLEKYKDPTKVIITSGQLINTWRLIVKGQVLKTPNNGENQILTVNHWFGFDIEDPNTLDESSCASYQIFDEDCELVVVNLDDYNTLMSEKRTRASICETVLEDVDTQIETMYKGDLITSGAKEKLVEALFDGQYTEIEPGYVQDFFITYKLFIPDDSILTSIIKTNASNSLLAPKAAFVLYTWITCCFQDFQTDYMRDFVVAVLHELNDFDQEICKKIVSAFTRRTKAQQIKYVWVTASSLPICISYRLFTDNQGSTVYEYFVHSVDMDSTLASSKFLKGDEIICLNDAKVFDSDPTTLFKVFRSNLVNYFVIKRCNIKYSFYKEKLNVISEDDVLGTSRCSSVSPCSPFDKNGQFSTLTKSTKKKNTWKSWTLRRFNTPKRQAVVFRGSGSSSQESVNTQNEGNTEKVKKVLQKFGKNIDMVAVQNSSGAYAGNATESQSQSIENLLSVRSGTGQKVSSVIRLFDVSNEPKYFFSSRCDTGSKICLEVASYFLMQQKKQTIMQTIDSKPSKEDVFGQPLFMFESSISTTGLKNSRLPETAFDFGNRINFGSRYYISPTVTNIKLNKQVEKMMKKDASISFLDFEPKSVALLLALMDFVCISRVSPQEYIQSVYRKSSTPAPPNFEFLMKRTNAESDWVKSEILMEPNIARRSLIVKNFIIIANVLLEIGSLFTFSGIVLGLECNLISRLKTTWAGVHSRYLKLFEILRSYVGLTSNQKAYRNYINKGLQCTPGDFNMLITPFIMTLSRDLTFIKEGNKIFKKNDEVNYEAMRLIANSLKCVTYFFNQNYSVKECFSAVEKTVENYFLKRPATFILPLEENDCISLSDLICDTITYFDIQRMGGKSKTKGLLNDCVSPSTKKHYDDFIECRKIIQFLNTAFASTPLNEDTLTWYSFTYDPVSEPAKVVVSCNVDEESCPSGSAFKVTTPVGRSAFDRIPSDLFLPTTTGLVGQIANETEGTAPVSRSGSDISEGLLI